MPKEKNRETRIEVRIAPDVLTVIKRAAKILGRSLSDFVVVAAQEAANRTIEEFQFIFLSEKEQRLFADCILSPPNASLA